MQAFASYNINLFGSEANIATATSILAEVFENESFKGQKNIYIQEADLELHTKIEQGTSLGSHFYNVMILKGLQVSLCDVDVLMSQQSGH